jgi:hypothetical protein
VGGKASHFSEVLCYNATLYRMMLSPAIYPESKAERSEPCCSIEVSGLFGAWRVQAQAG